MAGGNEQTRKQKGVEREQQNERPNGDGPVSDPNRQEGRPARGISPTDPADGPREEDETTNNPADQNTGD